MHRIGKICCTVSEIMRDGITSTDCDWIVRD